MRRSITEFGAKAEPDRLDTEAIQKALDACAEAGGGTVDVPPGVFRSGTLTMRSHTTLNLEPGATLLGPGSIDGYRPIPFAWDLYPHTLSFINAMGERDVRITGSGSIDLNGRAFADRENIQTGLPEDKRHLLTPEQLKSCHYTMPPRERRPNRLIFFHDCEDVEVSGVEILDSPTWALVFSRCRNIRVAGARVRNDLRIPNSDGIHCCGCENVLISECFVEGGDDCVALTGIAEPSAVTRRVIIESCVFRSASAALRIGFQAGKIEDVIARGLTIHDSNRAVLVCAGAGGYVRNVLVSDLIARTRIYPGPWWGKGEPLLVCAGDSTSSSIEGVAVRNVRAFAENGIVVYGKDGNIRDLTLADWNMELSYGAARPLYGSYLDLSPEPCVPMPDAATRIPWLVARGVVGLKSSGVEISRSSSDARPFSTERLDL